MKETLKKINELIELGIIEKYAIAGGMGQFYYIEPSVTYDLDLIIHIPSEESTLNPLSKIYEWADKNNYKPLKEHIIIEGIPVQFLLEYNDLVTAALNNRSKIKLFDEETYILKPEYLMAIMLQTGRSTDKERLTKFLTEADYNKDIFSAILNKFDLLNTFNKFIKRYE
jgi:hypothetical protein